MHVSAQNAKVRYDICAVFSVVSFAVCTLTMLCALTPCTLHKRDQGVDFDNTISVCGRVRGLGDTGQSNNSICTHTHRHTHTHTDTHTHIHTQ